MFKKLSLLFAALTLSAGLWAINNVPYIDANGVEQKRDSVTGVINSTDTLKAGWYVVMPTGNEKQTGTLVCQGEVHLIVYDGAKLTATGADNKPGIEVSGEGSSLTIYGYTNQSGQLIANGGFYAAGIGGGNGDSGSNITINGGIVTATGGQASAGIGGGNEDSGSNITINGGTVTATGGPGAAGIGGGFKANGSNITINGGTVTATGGNMAAGIGGGGGGNGTNITILAGTVTATGAENAAGIGRGEEGYASNIFVATSLVVKAGSSANPTDEIAKTRTATTDIANDLAGKQYVTVEQTEPEPVRLASDILIIDEVYDSETGNLVGWNYTMHEPSVDNIMLRTNSTDKYGTFSFEDKTLTDEIYNITRITEEGYKQQSFISGSMTIDEVGDSIVLDGLFLCEDGKTYALHFTHLKAALNEDTNMDFDADFEYYQMSSYLDGGVISIEAYSNSGMVHLELYADPAATTIPAGVYSLSDTQEAGTALASSGVVDREHTGCYAATLNTYTGDLHDLWFMTGGTITIGYDENGRLTVAVETTNSYGRNAHINVAYKPITPIATEEINNTSLFITNDAQRANVYDYMIYDEYSNLLAVLMVKTDTLCGEFENAVDLPQCAINVPGAIVPYYLIDAKPFTVSGEGKELSINVSVLAADTILYVITGTGYIGAIYPDTKDNYNGQYTTEELKMKQVEDGLVELTATNADNDDMTIVIWATLEEDGTLAKGEYNEIVASEGITEGNTVAPSAVVDANDNVWLIQSGKLTVAEDGLMVFEGLNTFDKKVTITIAPATALPANEVSDNVNKFMHEGQLIIRKAGKMYNMLGVEVR